MLRELENKYPFILPAVEAHIERIVTTGNIGRPTQSLIAIMKELETEEFGPVFKEFNKRESIYGFGDLQVKRLFDEIKNNLAIKFNINDINDFNPSEVLEINDELSQQELPSLEQQRDQVINLRSNVPGKGYQQRVIEDDIQEKKLENYILNPAPR